MKSYFVAPTLALALLGSSGAAFASVPSQPLAPQAYGQDHDDHHDGDRGGWDAPPGDFRDVQRQGFHDGIEAARNDFQSHQRPDPDHHREFRHPQVSPDVRDSYRDAYRRGYAVAMQHMQGGDRDHDHDQR